MLFRQIIAVCCETVAKCTPSVGKIRSYTKAGDIYIELPCALRFNAKICVHLPVFLATFQQQTLRHSGYSPSTNYFSPHRAKHDTSAITHSKKSQVFRFKGPMSNFTLKPFVLRRWTSSTAKSGEPGAQRCLYLSSDPGQYVRCQIRDAGNTVRRCWVVDLVLNIRAIPSSNLGRPFSGFSWYFALFLSNSRTVSSIAPRPLRLASCPVHYSIIINN